LVARHLEHRQTHLAEFAARTGDLDTLSEILAPCVNCYNCRVACPVCYCRECVFGTDTFRHDGGQYLGWSAKRGQLKLPADTLFYHLTRMVHMSTLCVGCGQCSSACPNDVPVWEVLSTVAERTQARFGYLPGRSLEEPQPLAVFQAEELVEVTGQVK
jgi:formate dehydrogenase subunit beta